MIRALRIRHRYLVTLLALVAGLMFALVLGGPRAPSATRSLQAPRPGP